jgi:methionyl-tRNA synthetase
MLKAMGLPVFTHLNVHGYWGLGGGKMSKSVGNVVEALALGDKYGNDAFRYFVMREMAFGLDADFSEEALVGRLNADLANDLGNLASRATTLLVNLRAGVVPAAGIASPARAALGAAFAASLAQVETAMAEFAFQRALAAIWEFVGAVNRYIDTAQPWALAKQPESAVRLDEVLFDMVQSLWCLGIVLDPFLPDAARKLRQAMGHTGEARLTDARWGALASGTTVQKVSGLFPRIEDKKAAAPAPAGAVEGAPRITVDDFGKIDLRVALVLAAEPVPKSRKLLKLRVSLGVEERTVLAGIAEHYGPADLVGKKVVVVANLQPAKLMGVESQGMILAGSVEGALGVLTPDRDLPPGAKVR